MPSQDSFYTSTITEGELMTQGTNRLAKLVGQILGFFE
jgi:hypothetical protein